MKNQLYLIKSGDSSFVEETEAIISASGGNVGIGTTSPDEPLHIESTSDSLVKLVQVLGSAQSDKSHLEFFSKNGEIETRMGRLGIQTDTDPEQDEALYLEAYDSNNVMFRAGSSTRMLITNDGNVGIGTTSPDETLHVSSSDGPLVAILEHTDGGSSELAFKDSQQQNDIRIGTADADFRVFTADEERMRINSSGNVGIGTTSPDAILQVQGADDTELNPLILRNNTNEIAKVNLEFQIAGQEARIGMHRPQLVNGSDLFFSTNDGTGTLQERMRIDAGGNVGIGTTNPGYKLHISGGTPAMKLEGSQPRIWLSENDQSDLNSLIRNNNSRFQIDTVADDDSFIANRLTILNSGGNVGIGTTSPDETLHVSSSDGPLVAILEHTDGGSSELAFKDSQQQNDIRIGTVDAGFRVFTADEERMRIDSSGNVGIGTASPDKRLEVVLTDDTAYGEGGTGRGIRVKNESESASSYTSLELIGGLAGAASIARIHAIQDNTTNASTSLAFTLRTSSDDTKERMRIDSAGNVGIGTTNPTSILHLEGDSPVLKIRSTDNWTATTGPVISFQGKNNTGDTKHFAGIKAYSAGAELGELAFNIRKGSTEPEHEAMRIDSDGNVGIGTTSPDKRLEVVLTDDTAYGEGGTGRGIRVKNESESASSYTSLELIGGLAGAASIARIHAIQDNTTNASTSLAFTLRTSSDDTKERMRIDSAGNVGIGTTSPNYQLELSTDSAAKPSTTTWTVSSDSRAKEDIQLADLDACYDNIKNIPLKRYTWSSEFYNEEQVKDRSKIGWIAQDVEAVFPKAVETHEVKYAQKYEEQVIPAVEEVLDEEGNVIQEAQEERVEQVLIEEKTIEDFKSLNADQLYASMYGAIQKLMQKVETLEQEVSDLKGA